MGKRWFTYACLAIVVVLTTGLAMVTYHWGRSQTADDLDELKAQLEGLRASENDAAVVKRVSQQMENIAYQQKEISDKQRIRAEEQSELAMQMRYRAEQESRLARQAEDMAVLAAREADEQRVNALIHQQTAEIQRDEATAAKSVSDTLSYRTLGRTLSTSALSQYESGNKEMASMLAYTGWMFIDKYRGNTYLPECFKAMNISAEITHYMKPDMDGSIQAICKAKGNTYAAVSDYGEIGLVSPESADDGAMLLHNALYDFRDVQADSSHVYALSLHGPLCIVDYHGKDTTVMLPSDESFLKMMDAGNDILLLAGRKSMVWYDKAKQHIVGFVRLSQTLASIVRCDDKVLLLFENGNCARLLDKGRMEPFEPLHTKERVTSAFYSPLTRRLYLGTVSGLILTYDGQMRYISTLYGHKGAINDMTQVGDIVVSNSYDKSTLIWNIPKVDEKLSDVNAEAKPTSRFAVPKEWVTPASIEFDSWPMAVCATSKGGVLIGLDDGRILHTNVITEHLAVQLRKNFQRNFTKEEWELYIGGTIPYMEVMKK